MFVVMGEPVAKERPRTYQTRSGKMRTVTPEKTQQAEATIGNVFRSEFVGFGNPVPYPVRVRLDFFTDSESKDVDNCTKTVLDALNQIVWLDDRQVEEVHARVHRKEREPQTWIDIRWWEGA